MSIRILVGDARVRLAELPAESVHCCVTSPPYFGLRDYGTGTWEGGDAACDHRPAVQPRRERPKGKLHGAQGDYMVAQEPVYREVCARCGARRVDRQVGLEATPAEYVAALVEVFREVRRVLRADGTLWLNLGDSYNADGRKGRAHMGIGKNSAYSTWSNRTGFNTKPKDLLGIPWRVAFALQSDGWWLRQDMIWHKPNPMPESVTDRCTKAHEYLFLLSKSARYYFDAAAIAEPAEHMGKVLRNLGTTKDFDPVLQRTKPRGEVTVTETRNKRSVWTIATAPYKEAHFATFPPALVEPCVLAGSPVDGTVLDPFAGSGTVGIVADRLDRSAVLVELNPTYAELARRRVAEEVPLWADVTVDGGAGKG